MIKELEINNFKKIQNAKLSFNEISLLIGGNSSGKSTVLKALNFLRAYIRDNNNGEFILKGGDYKTFKVDNLFCHDFAHGNNKSKHEFSLKINGTGGDVICFTFRKKREDVVELEELKCSGQDGEWVLKNNKAKIKRLRSKTKGKTIDQVIRGEKLRLKDFSEGYEISIQINDSFKRDVLSHYFDLCEAIFFKSKQEEDIRVAFRSRYFEPSVHRMFRKLRRNENVHGNRLSLGSIVYEGLMFRISLSREINRPSEVNSFDHYQSLRDLDCSFSLLFLNKLIEKLNENKESKLVFKTHFNDTRLLMSHVYSVARGLDLNKLFYKLSAERDLNVFMSENKDENGLGLERGIVLDENPYEIVFSPISRTSIIMDLVNLYIRNASFCHAKLYNSNFGKFNYRYITIERSRVNKSYWQELSLNFSHIQNELKDLRIISPPGDGIQALLTTPSFVGNGSTLSDKFESLLGKGINDWDKDFKSINRFVLKKYDPKRVNKESGKYVRDEYQILLGNVANLINHDTLFDLLFKGKGLKDYNETSRVKIKQEIEELMKLREQSSYKIKAFYYFIKWLRKFGIGDSVDVHQGINEFTPEILKKGKRIGLNDLGFGSSQLLGVLIEITIALFNKKEEDGDIVILIEELESNTHPDKQIQIGDMIIDYCNSFPGLKFLLETHSDHLLRHFQIAIGGKKMSNSCNINYMMNGVSKVVDINSDGTLSESIAKGFYGVASKQMAEFLKLHND